MNKRSQGESKTERDLLRPVGQVVERYPGREDIWVENLKRKWRKTSLERENSKCKGPGVGTNLTLWNKMKCYSPHSGPTGKKNLLWELQKPWVSQDKSYLAVKTPCSHSHLCQQDCCSPSPIAKTRKTKTQQSWMIKGHKLNTSQVLISLTQFFRKTSIIRNSCLLLHTDRKRMCVVCTHRILN